MSDDGLECLAMLGGVSVAQMTEAVERLAEAFRDAGTYTAELMPGLTFDDRRWVRELADVGFQPPAQFAERWLERSEVA